MKKRSIEQKKTVLVETTPGWATAAEQYAIALRAVIMALGALSFDAKRKVIRWACDAHEIDPTKL